MLAHHWSARPWLSALPACSLLGSALEQETQGMTVLQGVWPCCDGSAAQTGNACGELPGGLCCYPPLPVCQLAFFYPTQ